MNADRRLRLSVVEGDLNVLVECLRLGDPSPAMAILTAGGDDMRFVAEDGSMVMALLIESSIVAVCRSFTMDVDGLCGKGVAGSI